MNKYELEKKLTISNKEYKYFDIKGLSKNGYDIHSLPFSIRILVENILRNMDGKIVRKIDLEHLLKWQDGYDLPVEIPYHPSRILMQDFTGVPAVVDLAAMRDAVKKTGKDPYTINPVVPVDLVIDHSVQIDYYGTSDSLKKNVKMEYDRNSERYALLKWAQKNFTNFRVIPPGAGICHQVNLEYLGKVVTEADRLLYPDTLIGTD